MPEMREPVRSGLVALLFMPATALGQTADLGALPVPGT
jgi:hypothetical protein